MLSAFVETFDNIIIEVIRLDGEDIELRMAECMGKAGTARVSGQDSNLKKIYTDEQSMFLKKRKLA